MKRTVFNNFHEPNVVNKRDWYGNIVINKGEKSESEVYTVNNTTRIAAKNQLLEVAKRLNGQLVYMRAFNN